MSTDIFQFYSGSADAAPGKGVGESLVSPPETYKDLKKIPGWRRVLASSLASPDPQLDTVLALTGTAQLWFAPIRNAKLRRADLEEKRLMLLGQAQRPPVTQSEMNTTTSEKKEKKVKLSKPTTRAKKGGAPPEGKVEEAEGALTEGQAQDGITNTPEGAVVNGPAAEPAKTEAEVPDMDAPDKEESAIRFCPTCRYYLYLQVEGEDQSLFRVCRNCGHKEEDVKGGLVMEMMIRERAAEGYKILLNEYTRQDPRLPHIKTIPCPDPACDSNHGKAPSDVIYIKHDAVNMLYMYICDVCGFTWRSAR
jgi:DNA-directed RNA polymerase subunit M/transcription elongation factor TFIIS